MRRKIPITKSCDGQEFMDKFVINAKDVADEIESLQATSKDANDDKNVADEIDSV